MAGQYNLVPQTNTDNAGPYNVGIIPTDKRGNLVTLPTEQKPEFRVVIDVEVKDRLLMELKRRLFPQDVEGILYSAITGDLYWQDQLFQLMIDTWPRLQTDLMKLQRAVVKAPYTVNPYKEDDKKNPTASAIAKAETVKRGLFRMHANMAYNERDFKDTLALIVESILTGHVVGEVYWEFRDGEIVPQCTRRTPARYYRYPYVTNETDRLMLNPSGTLGGTQLMDFPTYKFLVCIKQSNSAHPVFTAHMRCLAAWWVASRFGLEWFMNYSQLFGIPFRKATYQTQDQQVVQQLINMLRNAGSSSWIVVPEGTDVDILAAPGATGHMPQERLLEMADKVCDILILGQTLTTEVSSQSGSRALGGIHKEVLDEITDTGAIWCCQILNTQVIPGIVQYNYGELTELPSIDPVVKRMIDVFQMSQSYNILFNQMRIPVKLSELYDRIEFTQPEEDDEELYEPPPLPTGGNGLHGDAVPGDRPANRTLKPTGGLGTQNVKGELTDVNLELTKDWIRY
jgi:phage gp29-like protein